MTASTTLSADFGEDASSPVMPPLVSVIIPAYNAEKYILEGIRSVLMQDYPSVEILVIDDGSKDATVALVQREAPQVQIIQQANAGAAAARNAGLRHAEGEYVCFLDADDGWFSGKLSAQVNYLQQHLEVGVVFHQWYVWHPEPDGSYLAPLVPAAKVSGEIDTENSGWIYSRLLLECIVHTSTVMMRREVVNEIGFFESSLVTGEDYDYWLRVSRKYQIHQLNDTFSFYREVAGSLTSATRNQNNEYDVLQRAISKWGLVSPDGLNVSEAVIKKRLAKLAFDFGYAHYHNGSIKLARQAFARCLRHEPKRWRALAYLLASWLKQSDLEEQPRSK
jgi:glycosyltransferase involved in cell wall biosynthesis